MGLRLLQDRSPQGEPLFNQRLRLEVQLHAYHPAEWPVLWVRSPIFHPHVGTNGLLCWDDLDRKGWLRVNRDVGLLLKRKVIPLMVGIKGHFSPDVFTRGAGHMNKAAADFYRQHEDRLPWEGRPLFRSL